MGFFSDWLGSFMRRRKEQKYLEVLSNMPAPVLRSALYEDRVCFSHIGLIGDIIYSIPAMLALAKGKDIYLYLDITQETMYRKDQKHYNGGKILTAGSIKFLKPLILSNPQFKVCEEHKGELIDYDLNAFRQYPFDYRMGHICRWYFLAFGINYDLGKPWLHANPNPDFAHRIIIARSFRYRAPAIDYSFMARYADVFFIGLDDEFADMQKHIPQLQHYKVSNALELASAIAGCRLFIGNQSFPFSVAEALKVKRVLEVCYECPNVIPEGDKGYDFCFQAQFEQVVKDILLK